MLLRRNYIALQSQSRDPQPGSTHKLPQEEHSTRLQWARNGSAFALDSIRHNMDLACVLSPTFVIRQMVVQCIRNPSEGSSTENQSQLQSFGRVLVQRRCHARCHGKYLCHNEARLLVRFPQHCDTVDLKGRPRPRERQHLGAAAERLVRESRCALGEHDKIERGMTRNALSTHFPSHYCNSIAIYVGPSCRATRQFHHRKCHSR